MMVSVDFLWYDCQEDDLVGPSNRDTQVSIAFHCFVDIHRRCDFLVVDMGDDVTSLYSTTALDKHKYNQYKQFTFTQNVYFS